jgi:hypothetical protein
MRPFGERSLTLLSEGEGADRVYRIAAEAKPGGDE